MLSMIAKDIILVLDQSGSMEGEKFIQAQQALHYVLDHLNKNDRFNIIAFSTGTQSYARGLRNAEEAQQAIFDGGTAVVPRSNVWRRRHYGGGPYFCACFEIWGDVMRET